MTMDNLEALAATAAEIDNAATTATASGPEQLHEEAPKVDPGTEVRGLLEALRAIASAKGFRHVEKTLDDDAIEAIVGALVPLLEKYGITASDFFGKWREEIMAALVVGPILLSLLGAFRADLDAKASAAAKDVTAQPAPVPAGVQQ